MAKLTKKIGHPYNPELAIGAVSLHGHILDERFDDIPHTYIDKQINNIRVFLEQQHEKFVGERKSPSIEGKIVIIVDDGIATGNTLLASIRMLRDQRPKKLVVAVPVAPAQTVEKIAREVDECIIVHAVKNFIGVGLYYDNVSPVRDTEVIRMFHEIKSIEHAS